MSMFSLLRSVTVIVAATSLSMVATGPVMADPPECDPYVQCDDPTAPYPPDGGPSQVTPCVAPWQEVFVHGHNMKMGSCVTGYDFATGTLSAETGLFADRFLGFHGCVKAQFIDVSGVMIEETPEHRWGVDIDDYRWVDWTDSGPGRFTAWDHVEFVHRRC